MQRSEWTSLDENWLRNNSGMFTVSEISDHLNKPVNAVRHKLTVMCLNAKSEKEKWSDKELIDLAKIKLNGSRADKVDFPGRSLDNLTAMEYKIGCIIRNYKCSTPEEILSKINAEIEENIIVGGRLLSGKVIARPIPIIPPVSDLSRNILPKKGDTRFSNPPAKDRKGMKVRFWTMEEMNELLAEMETKGIDYFVEKFQRSAGSIYQKYYYLKGKGVPKKAAPKEISTNVICTPFITKDTAFRNIGVPCVFGSDNEDLKKYISSFSIKDTLNSSDRFGTLRSVRIVTCIDSSGIRESIEFLDHRSIAHQAAVAIQDL
jgi:hypothetical protein